MTNEDLMTKGFNTGFLIQKFKPELAKALFKEWENLDDPYLKGMIAGSNEYLLKKEKDKSRLFPGMDENILPGALPFEKDEKEKGLDLDF